MKDAILESLRQEHACQGFIGKNSALTLVIQKLKKIASKNVSVLLVGETGTGKGLCAEFIHQYGIRFAEPFIPYNCGTGPESLFESQLFGHTKGAFTGADRDRAGLVEDAEGGILFLDEINSLNLISQVKLNHFLETGCFRRVGENRLRQADVRIIAASNVNLHKEVAEGHFREDLYFRLAEYELYVPPLRERKDDLVALTQYFLSKNAHLSTVGPVALSEHAVQQMLMYDWPGNIRELENVIKRLIIDATTNVIDFVALPSRTSPNANLPDPSESLQTLPWKVAKNQLISSFEQKYLKSLLHRYHGIVADCARHAGLQPPDFWKLMRKYKLKAEAFRGDRV